MYMVVAKSDHYISAQTFLRLAVVSTLAYQCLLYHFLLPNRLVDYVTVIEKFVSSSNRSESRKTAYLEIQL